MKQQVITIPDPVTGDKSGRAVLSNYMPVRRFRRRGRSRTKNRHGSPGCPQHHGGFNSTSSVLTLKLARSHDRDVGGVAPARHQNASDARHVVAGVERVPAPAEIGLKPRAEIHWRIVGWHADVGIAGPPFQVFWPRHTTRLLNRGLGKFAVDGLKLLQRDDGGLFGAQPADQITEPRSMDHFAGLDVSVKETSVCIVDDTNSHRVTIGSQPRAGMATLVHIVHRQQRVGFARYLHFPNDLAWANVRQELQTKIMAFCSLFV
jgi:hypothetical protein